MALLLVYITHPDEGTARSVTDQLLHRRLVACVHLFPIQSAYWWADNLQHEGEWVSILKTLPELENALEAAVTELHPYEVPCIVRYEIRANGAYEQWVRECVAV